MPLAYYQAVRPPLSTQEAKLEFVRYLASISITETLFSIRQGPSSTQRELIEALIHEALQNSTRESRADHGLELINLPFTSEEEKWFEHYLLVGPGKSIHGARDTVMTRKVMTGKMDDALDCGKHLSGRKFDGMTWETVKDAIEQGMGPRRGSQTPKYF